MGAEREIAPKWITRREAARRLGIGVQAMSRYAELSGIRRRILQGTWTTYHGGDVDAMAARVVIVGAGIAAEAVTR